MCERIAPARWCVLKNLGILKKKKLLRGEIWKIEEDMAVDVQATEAEVVEACVHGGEKLQFASSKRGLKYRGRGATRNDYQRVWRAVKAAKDEKDALAQQKKSKMNNVRLT